jgi:uncharacterized protein (TIGR00251 family)
MKYSIVVKAGSSQEKVEKTENGLIVFTHARAHDGEANKKIVEILADYFQVSKSQIEITSGQKSKKKTIEVIK